MPTLANILGPELLDASGATVSTTGALGRCSRVALLLVDPSVSRCLAAIATLDALARTIREQHPNAALLPIVLNTSPDSHNSLERVLEGCTETHLVSGPHASTALSLVSRATGLGFADVFPLVQLWDSADGRVVSTNVWPGIARGEVTAGNFPSGWPVDVFSVQIWDDRAPVGSEPVPAHAARMHSEAMVRAGLYPGDAVLVRRLENRGGGGSALRLGAQSLENSGSSGAPLAAAAAAAASPASGNAAAAEFHERAAGTTRVSAAPTLAASPSLASSSSAALGASSQLQLAPHPKSAPTGPVLRSVCVYVNAPLDDDDDGNAEADDGPASHPSSAWHAAHVQPDVRAVLLSRCVCNDLGLAEGQAVSLHRQDDVPTATRVVFATVEASASTAAWAAAAAAGTLSSSSTAVDGPSTASSSAVSSTDSNWNVMTQNTRLSVLQEWLGASRSLAQRKTDAFAMALRHERAEDDFSDDEDACVSSGTSVRTSELAVIESYVSRGLCKFVPVVTDQTVVIAHRGSGQGEDLVGATSAAAFRVVSTQPRFSAVVIGPDTQVELQASV